MMIIIYLICVCIYMSFIIIFHPKFGSVICCHLYHNFFEAVKELHKFTSQILIYTEIVTYTTPLNISSKKQNSKPITWVIQSWWYSSYCSCKTNCFR